MLWHAILTAWIMTAWMIDGSENKDEEETPRAHPQT